MCILIFYTMAVCNKYDNPGPMEFKLYVVLNSQLDIYHYDNNRCGKGSKEKIVLQKQPDFINNNGHVLFCCIYCYVKWTFPDGLSTFFI